MGSIEKGKTNKNAANENVNGNEQVPGFLEKFKFWRSADSNNEDVKNANNQKKTLAQKIGFKKVEEPEPEPQLEQVSEDMFMSRFRKNKKDETNKKSDKNKKSVGKVQAEDFVRIQVWVRRNRNESFQPAKFCDCLVDYFAAADQRNVYSAPSIRFNTASTLQLNSTSSGSLQLNTNTSSSIPQLNSTESSLQIPGTENEPTISSAFGTHDEEGSKTPMGSYLGCCGSSRLSSAGQGPPSTAGTMVGPNSEAISVSVECLLQDNRVLIQPAPFDERPDRGHSKMRKSRRRPGAMISYISVLEVRVSVTELTLEGPNFFPPIFEI